MDVTEKYIRFAGMKLPSTFVIWLGWIVWIPFLVSEILDVIRVRPPAGILTLTLFTLVLFGALYAWATWHIASDLKRLPLEEYREQGSRHWTLIAVLCALSVASLYLGSLSKLEQWGAFIYTAAYVAGVLRPKQVLATNALILVLGTAADWIFNGAFFGFGMFLIGMVSFSTAGWEGAFLLARRLGAAQAQIEALAVGAERLRIARDLHDLLGQKLSLIILKSQLGRKLLRQDPERAEKEIAEVESTARAILQEVRDAVGRYQRPTVVEEIRRAREILAMAGIDFAYTPPASGLPELHDEVLAWTIREGVTNVVRHSRATTCRIRIDRSDEAWKLQIVDDGRPGKPLPERGHGLLGLEARAKAAGGRCEAALRPGGGFELSVTLPLAPGEPTA